MRAVRLRDGRTISTRGLFGASARQPLRILQKQLALVGGGSAHTEATLAAALRALPGLPYACVEGGLPLWLLQETLRFDPRTRPSSASLLRPLFARVLAAAMPQPAPHARAVAGRSEAQTLVGALAAVGVAHFGASPHHALPLAGNATPAHLPAHEKIAQLTPATGAPRHAIGYLRRVNAADTGADAPGPSKGIGPHAAARTNVESSCWSACSASARVASSAAGMRPAETRR
jgi:hypothetical protein